MAQPMRTPEEKLKIIAEYKEALGKQPGSASAVAKKHGVSSSLINFWINSPKTQQAAMSDEEKAKILADVFGKPEGKHRNAAAREHGVPMSTLYLWKSRANIPPPAPKTAKATEPAAPEPAPIDKPVPEPAPHTIRRRGTGQKGNQLVLTPDQEAKLSKEILAANGWRDYEAIGRRWGITGISVYGRYRKLTGKPSQKRRRREPEPEPVAAELIAPSPEERKTRRGRNAKVQELVQLSNMALQRSANGSASLADRVKHMLADCIRYGRTIGVEVVSVAVHQGTVTVTTQSTETYDL